MGKDFNLDRVGKRMPYTTPPGFFDTLERGIKEKTQDVATRASRRRSTRRRAGLWITATAAAMTAAVALNVPTGDNAQPAPLNTELAFANLSADDQEYFIGLLDDDVFFSDNEIYINEQ